MTSGVPMGLVGPWSDSPHTYEFGILNRLFSTPWIGLVKGEEEDLDFIRNRCERSSWSPCHWKGQRRRLAESWHSRNLKIGKEHNGNPNSLLSASGQSSGRLAMLPQSITNVYEGVLSRLFIMPYIFFLNYPMVYSKFRMLLWIKS